ncbi:MAG: Nramp family divalent metal transporter [Planctomycetaceae bacterium]
MPETNPYQTNAEGPVAAPTNPYQLTEATIVEPPTNLAGKLKYLGPGFILSASIVGSGELIATTILGARAGFLLLWFIIFSCLVKVAVQLEFGKHAISSGEATMASFNTLPGPKFGSANWSIWTWLLLMLAKMLQVGGIVGGVVLAIEQFAPGVNRIVLTYFVAATVSLLVFGGYYRLLEKASLVMIAGFTLFTLMSLISLQSTDMAIGSADLISGLKPSMPQALAFLAIGAFGITGVGGDEIMAYNYWLIEKGYASFVGPKTNTPEWYDRARGWIRIMYLDAILAMIAYTSVTVMFYLLGAAILNSNGIVPEKDQLITSLGRMYTESLGPWAKNVFVAGAIIVLYSTLFAALAAWTRLFSDAFGRIGLYSFEDAKARKRAISFFAWVIPVIWGTLFLVFEAPGWMVIVGGLATTVILLIVVFAALFFRYRRLDKQLYPSQIYDAALWISVVAILIVALLGVRDVYTKTKDFIAPASPANAGLQLKGPTRWLVGSARSKWIRPEFSKGHLHAKSFSEALLADEAAMLFGEKGLSRIQTDTRWADIS